MSACSRDHSRQCPGTLVVDDSAAATVSAASLGASGTGGGAGAALPPQRRLDLDDLQPVLDPVPVRTRVVTAERASRPSLPGPGVRGRTGGGRVRRASRASAAA